MGSIPGTLTRFGIQRDIMKASEVAKWLMKTPDAEVLIREGKDWLECVGVRATGEHRNAVCLNAVDVNLGVDWDMTPLNPA